jgi:hypothetical protein
MQKQIGDEYSLLLLMQFDEWCKLHGRCCSKEAQQLLGIWKIPNRPNSNACAKNLS